MEDKISSVVEKELEEEPENVELIGEGLIHETYSFTCSGDEYILQFSGNSEKDHSALGHCLNFYNLLEDSDIPVPETVTDEVGEYNGKEYSIVKKLPGETAKLDISPKKVREAGKALAKIHNFREFDDSGWISFEDEVKVCEFNEGSLKQKVLGDLDGKVEIYRENGMENVAEEVEKFFENHSDEIPEGFQPVICHDDHSPENVLFQDGEVTGVIDFDFSYSGHDQRDLVKAANSFWMHDPGAEWDVREKLYEGYQEVRELDNSFRENEPVYRVETLFWLIANMIELRELEQEEKEFYEEEILEEVEKV